MKTDIFSALMAAIGVTDRLLEMKTLTALERQKTTAIRNGLIGSKGIAFTLRDLTVEEPKTPDTTTKAA
ncbi:hypothetical protein ACOJCT_004399 [Cronobacter dublinensis]